MFLTLFFTENHAWTRKTWDNPTDDDGELQRLIFEKVQKCKPFIRTRCTPTDRTTSTENLDKAITAYVRENHPEWPESDKPERTKKIDDVGEIVNRRSRRSLFQAIPEESKTEGGILKNSVHSGTGIKGIEAIGQKMQEVHEESETEGGIFDNSIHSGTKFGELQSSDIEMVEVDDESEAVGGIFDDSIRGGTEVVENKPEEPEIRPFGDEEAGNSQSPVPFRSLEARFKMAHQIRRQHRNKGKTAGGTKQNPAAVDPEDDVAKIPDDLVVDLNRGYDLVFKCNTRRGIPTIPLHAQIGPADSYCTYDESSFLQKMQKMQMQEPSSQEIPETIPFAVWGGQLKTVPSDAAKTENKVVPYVPAQVPHAAPHEEQIVDEHQDEHQNIEFPILPTPETIASKSGSIENQVLHKVKIGQFIPVPPDFIQQEIPLVSNECWEGTCHIKCANKDVNILPEDFAYFETNQYTDYLEVNCVGHYGKMIAKRNADHSDILPPVFSFFCPTPRTTDNRYGFGSGMSDQLLADYDLIAVPVRILGRLHFVQIYIFPKLRIIACYDPLGINATYRSSLGREDHELLLNSVEKWIVSTTTCDKWDLKMLDGPRQIDGFNCGVCTCQHFEALSRGCKPDFGVDDLPTRTEKEERFRQLRRKMKAEILQYKLLDSTFPTQQQIVKWEVDWDYKFLHVVKWADPPGIVFDNLDGAIVDLQTQAPAIVPQVIIENPVPNNPDPVQPKPVKTGASRDFLSLCTEVLLELNRTVPKHLIVYDKTKIEFPFLCTVHDCEKSRGCSTILALVGHHLYAHADVAYIPIRRKCKPKELRKLAVCLHCLNTSRSSEMSVFCTLFMNGMMDYFLNVKFSKSELVDAFFEVSTLGKNLRLKFSKPMPTPAVYTAKGERQGTLCQSHKRHKNAKSELCSHCQRVFCVDCDKASKELVESLGKEHSKKKGPKANNQPWTCCVCSFICDTTIVKDSTLIDPKVMKGLLECLKSFKEKKFMLSINVAGHDRDEKTSVMLVETVAKQPTAIRLDFFKSAKIITKSNNHGKKDKARMSYPETQCVFLELLATVNIKPVLRIEDGHVERYPLHATASTCSIMVALFYVFQADVGKVEKPENDDNKLAVEGITKNIRLIFFANAINIVRNAINLPKNFESKFQSGRRHSTTWPITKTNLQDYLAASEKLDVGGLLPQFDDARFSDEDKFRLLENGRQLFLLTFRTMLQNDGFKASVDWWCRLGIDSTYMVYHVSENPKLERALIKVADTVANFWWVHYAMNNYQEFFQNPLLPDEIPMNFFSVVWNYGTDGKTSHKDGPFVPQPGDLEDKIKMKQYAQKNINFLCA